MNWCHLAVIFSSTTSSTFMVKITIYMLVCPYSELLFELAATLLQPCGRRVDLTLSPGLSTRGLRSQCPRRRWRIFKLSKSPQSEVINVDVELLNPRWHQLSEAALASSFVCFLNWWRAGRGNDPLFPGSICPLTRDHRRDGAPRGAKHFTPFFSFSLAFFLLS